MSSILNDSESEHRRKISEGSQKPKSKCQSERFGCLATILSQEKWAFKIQGVLDFLLNTSAWKR
jgi:hypothetical protein